MVFRKDINGLRAIAVLTVVFFHFNREWLPGGFVGVDIFFAISGYLMTSIIFRGINNSSFSLIEFIKRRVKRIIPPLIIVIIASLGFGYLVIEPITYQLAGRHGFYSLLFLSNYIYNVENGYFDAGAATKIFLHTWSLSVEWQFYIAYPIIIYFICKIFSVNAAKTIVTCSFILLYLLGIYFTKIDQPSAYFMFYTRAWEMLAGGLAFLYPLSRNDNQKKLIQYAGLILIIISCVLFSERTPWPGHYAILPVLGSLLCIAASYQYGILSSKPMQIIGSLSYSIYLVHWPILTISRNAGIDINFLQYLITTLLFAAILYYLVESRAKYWYAYVPVYLLALLASYYVSLDGIMSRVDPQFQLTAAQYHKKYYGGSGFLTDGSVQMVNSSGEDAEFIITGDSYSRQYLRYLKNDGHKFISIMRDGCFSYQDYMSKRDPQVDNECSMRYLNLVSMLEKYPNKKVVIIQSWGDYKNRLTPINNGAEEVTPENYYKIVDTELSKIFKKWPNRKFYIVGSNFTTNGNAVYDCLSKNSMNNWFTRTFVSSCDGVKTNIPSNDNYAMLQLAKKHKNVEFIDPNKSVCDKNSCVSLTKDGEPVLSDGSHLSFFGAKLIGRNVFSKIN
ncbi:acyltransferase family protein [Escherichia coli]|nr:acyltransferase family protein [Escherichia coli]EGY1258444.1 acyltransferase [Escherichia coli]MBB9388139.1 acyltransferase [Escherichia coli]